jgi:molecular chaperone GrpE
MTNSRNGRTIKIPVQTAKRRQLPGVEEGSRLLLSGPDGDQPDLAEAKPVLEDADCGNQVSDLRAEVEGWQEQVSKLEGEVESWKTQALGLQVEAQDWENQASSHQNQIDDLKTRVAQLQNREAEVRRRAEHQAKQQIGQERDRLLKRMLSVADDLERAISHADKTDPLRAGVELTRNGVLKQLCQEGVEPIQALGRRFDPNLHEAVSTDGTGVDHVVKVLRTGYSLNGELLRPAQVVVGRLLY